MNLGNKSRQRRGQRRGSRKGNKNRSWKTSKGKKNRIIHKEVRQKQDVKTKRKRDRAMRLNAKGQGKEYERK